MAFILAEATTLIADPRADIATWGAEIYYMQQQLNLLVDPQTADVDTALKALVDAQGRQLLPAGHSSTQAQFQWAFNNYPLSLLRAQRIYMRALTARYGGGGGPISVNNYFPGGWT